MSSPTDDDAQGGTSPANDSSPAVVAAPAGAWVSVRRWLGASRRNVVIVLLAMVAASGVAVATVDVTDYVFSTQNFCAFTCHVMESTVYEEMKESKHWTTPSGVRAKCADCHVAGRLTFAMWDHFLGTTELWVQAITPADGFEALRPAAAERVRMKMLKDDSANCRECHVMEAIKPRRVRGQRQHDEAREKGTTCIACHYNLVHKEVEPSEAFLKAIAEM